MVPVVPVDAKELGIIRLLGSKARMVIRTDSSC
jgi:hypothetical protein